MIPQIKEINFPEYATLSTATATLVDMGDKTIAAQVKIDGSIVPDFSYDWEIEFQGERYIHPLREPQASKGNESISSIIDLTFYHKGIYDLKRYFFVSTAETEAGTIMADNYIVPLAMNIGKFVEALNKVLKLYYGQPYLVDLNPEYEYDETDIKYIDINYTKIWDIFVQFYEWFGVKWSLETHDAGDDLFYYTFKVGYPSREVSHIFKYGFEGGLLKFERQVQDAEIRNQMFGRGGSQNLPYRYFKKFDPNNPSWKADPDWIPELALINFSELRGKSFRDYVRGWKAKHYGGQLYLPPTDAYTKGYTDEKFDPVDYVEDKVSIAKYGIIQGGLDNNEEIFPTIQKRDLGDGLGRADEIIDAELILVDEPTTNTESVANIIVVDDSDARRFDNPSNYTSITLSARSADIYVSSDGSIVKDIDISIAQYVKVTRYSQQYDSMEGWYDIGKRVETNEVNTLQIDTLDVSVIDANTKSEITDIANIPQGTTIYISASATASGLLTSYIEELPSSPDGYQYRNVQEVEVTSRIVTSFQAEIDLTPFHGLIIGNYVDGVNRVSASATIGAEGSSRVTLKTETFTIDEGGATSVDVPMRITSSDTSGSYSERKTINAVNTSTNEVLDPSNLSEGTYYLQIVVDITNLTKKSQTYKVELLPSYIYYPYDSAKWRPTFDIWIKDIWESSRLDGENDTSYAERVWRPILGDRQGNEAKVVFSSGWLSGHSGYEFPIVAFAFDDTKTLKGVPSHWRLTLAKSDAEVDASGKWLPSTQTQASAGDHFYFIGIDMPHQYVLWAEEEVDKWKWENMPSRIKPSFVVQTDKVRLNELQEGETRPLLNSLRIGNSIRTADFRFIEGDYEVLHLRSVTYTWDASTIMLPNIEVVLSDKVVSDKNSIEETRLTISKISLDVSEIAESTKVKFDKLNRTYNRVDAQTLTATTLATTAKTLATDAQTTANKADENATKVGATVTVIGNQIGTMNTNISKAQSAADSAKSEADKANSNIEKVSTDTTIKFQAVNTSISKIEKDVDDIESLIGDEYNIWFEPDTQIGSEPNLSNYPASDWTSDDDYFNHDKDLYYSISLGRAWRFMYNEGSPYWEEITDSDTITALTKAQEALDKAQEALDEANSVAYIKGVFGEDNVLDEKAAILGRLIAVKNESDDIVAGLYGGNSAELNANGYADNEYGTLLIFAGSPSADKVSESDFKVYENGRVEIKTGVFTGLTKHKIINIDNSNVDKFFPITTGESTTPDGSSINRRALSPDIFTSITRFSSTFTKYSDISINLPAIYNFNLNDELGEFTKDELRELAGNTFYIYNDSSAFIYLCGYSYDEDSSELVGPVCFGNGIIEEGEFAKITCILDVVSGKEILYWRYTIGRTRRYTIPLEE